MRLLVILLLCVSMSGATNARAQAWDGFYIEGAIGGVNLDYSFDQKPFGFAIPAVSYSSKAQTKTGRLSVGYGWQSGRYGQAIELGYTMRDLENAAETFITGQPVRYAVTVPHGFDLTAKLGYQLTEKAMVSVLGGVAHATVSVDGAFVNSGVKVADSATGTYGLRLGLGVDYRVSERVSLTSSLVQTYTELDIDETVVLGTTQARSRRTIDGTMSELFVGIRFELD